VAEEGGPVPPLLSVPGDKGTRKLVERFGERLLRVRYVYDAANGRRLKTAELIVQLRIAFDDAELRERAKRLGAIWRPAQKLWEITWRDAKRLGLADRVAAA